jgi:uric acid-xanthine permease
MDLSSGNNHALRGFLDSIIIVISTPFLIAALIEIILNLTLPDESDTQVVEDEEDLREQSPDLENGRKLK